MAHPSARTLGRYVLHDRIASGGMASVYLGRLVASAGFARTVAIKRLHPALADDRDAVAMLINEARIAGRLHHPNVTATLDVVVERDDAFVIMDYVHGESLARLLAASGHGPALSARVVSSILSGALRGLHAAHEARNERDEPLEIVHRDVSPQNVLVGADGVARLIDFGIAKGRMHAQTTVEGRLKGKLSYLAPEQIQGKRATRQTDVYAAGIVLWEALTGRRLFDGDCAGAITEQILVGWVDPPSKYVPQLSEDLDKVVLRALETEPSRRFATAEEMATALELAEGPAPAVEVGAWVVATAGDALRERQELQCAIEALERSRWSTRSWLARPALLAGFAVVLTGATAIGLSARSSSTSSAISPVHESSEATAIVDENAIRQPNEISRPPDVAAASAATEALQQARVAPLPREANTSSVPPRAQRPRQIRPIPQPQADDCNPPYNVNADGIRLYKRHCLRK